MTKAISAGLQQHIASELTTLATLWKITRSDGEVFTFTDHDVDITYDGLVYSAGIGYTATQVDTSADLSVPNLDVESIIDSESITEGDLLAGKWDFARVEVWQVNWKDLTQGALHMRAGTLGEVTLGKLRYRAELRGLQQFYQQKLIRAYTPGCRAKLGDTKCGVNLASITQTGSVVSASSRLEFIAQGLSQPTQHYFRYGLLTWTSGLNAGTGMEVKLSVDGAGSPTPTTVTLQLPMTYDIEAGDAFTVYPGCDKSITTCDTVFGNDINFRGEPYVPTYDTVFTIARK